MFCSVCGSSIAATHDLDTANIYISLGCLEPEIDIDIQYQQFVKSKASWVELDTSIRLHDEWLDWVYERIGKTS